MRTQNRHIHRLRGPLAGVALILFALAGESRAGRFEEACGELRNDRYLQDQYEFCVQAEIASESDCEECFALSQDRADPAVEIAQAVAMPLAILGSTALSSYFGYKSQKAWANSHKAFASAYETGQRECTARFGNYTNYSMEIGAPPLLAKQAKELMQCNGEGLSQFAGFGGGGSPFLSAGYSPGFMAGMMGPHFGAGAGLQIGFGAGAGAGAGLGAYPGMYGPGMGAGIGAGAGLQIGINPGLYGPGAGAGIGAGAGFHAGIHPGMYGPGAGARIGAGAGFHAGLHPGTIGAGAGFHAGMGLPYGGAGWHGQPGGHWGAQGGPGGGYWGNTGGWNSGGNAYWDRQRAWQDEQQRRRAEWEEQRRRAEEERRRALEEQRRRAEEERRRRQAEYELASWNNSGNASSSRKAVQGLYEDYVGAARNYRQGAYRYTGGGRGGLYGPSLYSAGGLGVSFGAGVRAGVYGY